MWLIFIGKMGIVADGDIIGTTKKNFDFTRVLAVCVESSYEIFAMGYRFQEPEPVNSRRLLECSIDPIERTEKSDKEV